MTSLREHVESALALFRPKPPKPAEPAVRVVPANPLHAAGRAPVLINQEQTGLHRLANDPSYCCEACEDLTALIRTLGDGPELDAAVAAHPCTRSPITAAQVVAPALRGERL